MKNVILLVFILALGIEVQAQRSKYPSKTKEESISLKDRQLKFNPIIKAPTEPNKTPSILRNIKTSAFNPVFEKDYLIIQKDEQTHLPIFIKKPVSSERSSVPLQTQSIQFLESVKKQMQIEQPSEEFVLIQERLHKRNNTTLKYGQIYKGLPVLDAEVILQVENTQVHSMSGRYHPTPSIDNITPSFDMDGAFDLSLLHVAQYSSIAREDVAKHMNFACSPDTKQLVIYHDNDKPVLAWHFEFHPNLKERWTYVLDAHTGDIYSHYKSSCSLHNYDVGSAAPAACGHLHHKAKPATIETHKTERNKSSVAGPFVGSGTDLLGINRPINGYESGGTYVLADASRSMFDAGQSNMPNQPVGAIWTLDAMNTSPESNSFDYDHSQSSSPNWNNQIQVSGHFNSGEAYEYYTNTHQRNSVNGTGGNIVCFVNVSEKNGSSMENAYWNGNAMFYGNGGNAFQPLARALDVAGHEISHGVVQTTANLKYENQSGAMNESFADIFGAMIDRNDWKIGEDVVNQNVFPSGALRDLQNPNNGGSSLSDAGWQPKNMSEYQNLPNTPQGDNGGVHINSGITNHAFYKIATNIGKSNAEDIFYKALTEYLVRSSQFIDLRIAAEQSAKDLFGNGSAQLAAVQQGFNEVGIGSGSGPVTGTDTQTELETNTGTDYILYSDPQLSNLYIVPSADVSSRTLISEKDQVSKPSITDDGTAIVFIGADKMAHIVQLNFSTGEVTEGVLSDQPIWRNIVIAKDGSKVALVTDDRLPEILVFDFNSQSNQVYNLYNPTFTQGVSTGDVLFADVMEFDYSGEFLMYDAQSELAGANFGEFIQYWDIGFMQVWSNSSNSFVSGDNNISKLFNQVPENSSVGNPSFSKEADFIVTFDFIDEQNDASIFAVNTETGATSREPLFVNSILNYPNYSIDDGAVIFDANSNGGDAVIGRVAVAGDRLNTTGEDPGIFLDNAKWGTWFGTAQRNLTDTYELNEALDLSVFPNPAEEQITIQFANPTRADAIIEIHNIQGQLMSSTTLSSGSQTAKHQQNIAELSNGVYLIKILIDNQYATTKLTVQR